MKTAGRKNIFLAAAAGAAIAALPVFIVLADAGIVPDACRLGNAGPCTICHLGVLVINFTKFLMYTIAFPAAVLLIIIGGLTLLVSGPSETTRTLGKKILTNTLIGMIIIMLAWLAVDTIIKFLVGGGQANFIGLGPWHTIDAANCLISGESLMPSLFLPPPPTVSVPAGAVASALLRRLNSSGIEVRSSGNCSNPNNSSCTSLEGMPESVVDKLIEIKRACGSEVAVTGGTEVGHVAHGPTLPVVDIGYNMETARCVRDRATQFNIARICTRPQESAYRRNCGANETEQHLHLEFSS